MIEFTIPPSPPLVAKIARDVNFPQGQLVVATNLLDALRKKYGQESLQGNSSTTSWVFDSAGKPVSRPLQRDEVGCLPGGPHFGWQVGCRPSDMDRDYPTQLNVAQLAYDDPERSPACLPFGIVVAIPSVQATLPPSKWVAWVCLSKVPLCSRLREGRT